jgi:hypothetical protein
MWDMGYEDEHLLVRHYPWVNNPLRAWAQCRRPQELITFFWTERGRDSPSVDRPFSAFVVDGKLLME